MTWKEAKEAAHNWLQEIGVPEDLKGQEIHVEKLAEELPLQGKSREFIINAAKRILKRRGAKIVTKASLKKPGEDSSRSKEE